MSMKNTILVVGGGIGGMAAALALHRGGQAVEMVEADPAWNALGAGLTLNGGALRAFKELGLLERVMQAGFASVGSGKACDEQGNIVGEGPATPMFGEGVPNMGGILRPRLHRVLRDVIEEAGIPVRTGVSAERYEEVEGGVRVHTSDGQSRVHRFVVAADGVMSRTRAQLFPDLKPQFTGQGCWRAVVSRPADVTSTWVYSSLHIKAGFNPISPDLMYVYVMESAPGNPWIDQADWLPLLKQKLARFGGHFPAIVEELDEHSQINYRPLDVILMPRPWHKGHVLMVGDASHATTPHVGYGAGMAIEDAVVLGEMVGQHDDVEALFTAFTQRRHERCRIILEGSVAIGQLELDGAPFAEQRALGARLGATIREAI